MINGSTPDYTDWLPVIGAIYAAAVNGSDAYLQRTDQGGFWADLSPPVNTTVTYCASAPGYVGSFGSPANAPSQFTCKRVYAAWGQTQYVALALDYYPINNNVVGSSYSTLTWLNITSEYSTLLPNGRGGPIQSQSLTQSDATGVVALSSLSASGHPTSAPSAATSVVQLTASTTGSTPSHRAYVYYRLFNITGYECSACTGMSIAGFPLSSPMEFAYDVYTVPNTQMANNYALDLHFTDGTWMDADYDQFSHHVMDGHHQSTNTTHQSLPLGGWTPVTFDLSAVGYKTVDYIGIGWDTATATCTSNGGCGTAYAWFDNIRFMEPTLPENTLNPGFQTGGSTGWNLTGNPTPTLVSSSGPGVLGGQAILVGSTTGASTAQNSYLTQSFRVPNSHAQFPDGIWLQDYANLRSQTNAGCTGGQSWQRVWLDDLSLDDGTLGTADYYATGSGTGTTPENDLTTSYLHSINVTALEGHIVVLHVWVHQDGTTGGCQSTWGTFDEIRLVDTRPGSSSSSYHVWSQPAEGPMTSTACLGCMQDYLNLSSYYRCPQSSSGCTRFLLDSFSSADYDVSYGTAVGTELDLEKITYDGSGTWTLAATMTVWASDAISNIYPMSGFYPNMPTPTGGTGTVNAVYTANSRVQLYNASFGTTSTVHSYTDLAKVGLDAVGLAVGVASMMDGVGALDLVSTGLDAAGLIEDLGSFLAGTTVLGQGFSLTGAGDFASVTIPVLVTFGTTTGTYHIVNQGYADTPIGSGGTIQDNTGVDLAITVH